MHPFSRIVYAFTFIVGFAISMTMAIGDWHPDQQLVNTMIFSFVAWLGFSLIVDER